MRPNKPLNTRNPENLNASVTTDIVSSINHAVTEAPPGFKVAEKAAYINLGDGTYMFVVKDTDGIFGLLSDGNLIEFNTIDEVIGYVGDSWSGSGTGIPVNSKRRARFDIYELLEYAERKISEGISKKLNVSLDSIRIDNQHYTDNIIQFDVSVHAGYRNWKNYTCTLKYNSEEFPVKTMEKCKKIIDTQVKESLLCL